MVSLLCCAVGIPILLYLLLWLNPVHEKMRSVAESRLSELLGADVEIGRLRILPFNRVEISDVAVIERADTLLTAAALNAGISGRNLLFRQRLVITDVELMSPDIRLRRANPESPLNIQPVIDKLKGDGSKPPSQFDIAVHTVVIRSGSGSYNVDSAPARPGFDPNHLRLLDLNADLTAPRIANGKVRVSLKRLTVAEQSGLRVRRLAADVELADSLLSISGFNLALNSSELHLEPTTLNLKSRAIGRLKLLSGSTINPADLAPIVPQLAEVPSPLMIQADAQLFRDSLSLNRLEMNVPSRLIYADLRAQATPRMANSPRLELGVDGHDLANTIALFTHLKPKAAQLLESLGKISFVGSAGWRKPENATVNGLLSTNAGAISLEAELSAGRLLATAESPDLDLALILPGKQLGSTDFAASVNLARTDGMVSLLVDWLDWRGKTVRNIAATANYRNKDYHAGIAIADSALTACADLTLDMTPDHAGATIIADIGAFEPAAFGFLPQYVGHVASAHIRGAFSGPELLQPTGRLTIRDLAFVTADGTGLREDPIVIKTDFSSENSRSIELTSDLIDLDARGSINLKTIRPAIGNLLADAMPQYFAPQPVDSLSPNDFTLQATIHDNAPLLGFIAPPVQLLYPISVSGSLSEPNEFAGVSISAPYLSKGNSLISHTRLEASLGKNSELTAHSVMPSKFGNMTLDLSADLSADLGNLNFTFANDQASRYGGTLNASIRPLPSGADIHINPETLTLGNVDWDIEPAYIGLRGKSAILHGFGISRPGQELAINGMVSDRPDDRLIVELDNVNVDYIFQTLRLNPSITFGGDATGTVIASGILSPEPVLQTKKLFVRNLNYGHCVMGDASISSRWNNESHAVEIYADIPNRQTGGKTIVDGKILPLSSQLDFVFTADHTPVGFIHNFTKNWASDVSGTASGRAHLFGDFKFVDLEGDLFAENLNLSILFTNVTYSASDSVHIRPGVIDLSNITISDPEGHRALLNGSLHHRYFLESDFRFRISDMQNMLVLNTRPQSDEDFWYGRIHADGVAEISGVPGLVTISANARTTADSEFTFVLSDAANAAEYTFLTFRDATPRAPLDSTARPGSPELDEMMRARVAKAAQQADATNFNFDMHVDVTPEARLNLIMDPNAGDKITAAGAGNIDLLYGSQTDEFRLFGEYLIDKGDYNFSLQDIILKKFQISSGSKIAFDGDPMNATLGISAIYQVNANLSDLDESFLNDKEVQRTNVPVYAVLNVNGRLSEPVISFDLDFPTLTTDVKRKVKSIVSTEEMMNRQIIYLLALNRFYTPDYMTATKGNDLMSVASGTISSQLSNILGQLSDKISVAPSVRTDNGDFSDVEVDVALSSNLLNNRLLLNGNFGYRDKALNSNQFIGDFDVEYLLTRQGNWRVKAYNHFNDRNLYVKTALTTQGIGLVFKHDFDNLFKPIWKSQKKSITLQPQ